MKSRFYSFCPWEPNYAHYGNNRSLLTAFFTTIFVDSVFFLLLLIIWPFIFFFCCAFTVALLPLYFIPVGVCGQCGNKCPGGTQTLQSTWPLVTIELTGRYELGITCIWCVMLNYTETTNITGLQVWVILPEVGVLKNRTTSNGLQVQRVVAMCLCCVFQYWKLIKPYIFYLFFFLHIAHSRCVLPHKSCVRATV